MINRWIKSTYSLLNFYKIPWVRSYYYIYFMDEETESHLSKHSIILPHPRVFSLTFGLVLHGVKRSYQIGFHQAPTCTAAQSPSTSALAMDTASWPILLGTVFKESPSSWASVSNHWNKRIEINVSAIKGKRVVIEIAGQCGQNAVWKAGALN